jgi:hypothetical protein
MEKPPVLCDGRLNLVTLIAGNAYTGVKAAETRGFTRAGKMGKARR